MEIPISEKMLLYRNWTRGAYIGDPSNNGLQYSWQLSHKIRTVKSWNERVSLGTSLPSVLDRFSSQKTSNTELWLLPAVSSSIDGLSVCLSFSVSVTPFLSGSYLWIFMKRTPYIDRMKCLRHGSFEVLVMFAQWLPPYLTESLRNLRTCNTWWGDMLRTILRTKCQKSRSHGSFQVLALSAPWLHPYLTESLHIWHTYNIWGGEVLGIMFKTKC